MADLDILELPGREFGALGVIVLPRPADEFVWDQRFLVRHRSQRVGDHCRDCD